MSQLRELAIGTLGTKEPIRGLRAMAEDLRKTVHEIVEIGCEQSVHGGPCSTCQGIVVLCALGLFRSG